MSLDARSETLAAFSGELAAEQSEVAGFVELLSDEQLAIRSGELDRLESLQSEKRARIGALTEHARKRANALRLLGLPAGANGVEALAREVPSHGPTLLRAWQALQTKAWEANHLARLNAHLCLTYLLHFDSRLGALASAAAQPRDIYGVDGALRPAAFGRAIAQA